VAAEKLLGCPELEAVFPGTESYHLMKIDVFIHWFLLPQFNRSGGIKLLIGFIESILFPLPSVGED
jgi:hypothetical protein